MERERETESERERGVGERERERSCKGMEGQNPLVVSLGIPPCGDDRGVRRGRGGEERARREGDRRG